MPGRIVKLVVLLLFFSEIILAQKLSVGGLILSEKDRLPIAYSTVMIKESGQWAVSDDKGEFLIKNVQKGTCTVVIRSLGYVSRTFTLKVVDESKKLRILLKEENLKLAEVEAVAKRKNDDATTSYHIDRLALDNQQIINLSDIGTLLPGGKTVNSTLMDDDRMALRSGSSEKGNASFGTAVEVDGVRLGNNGAMSETLGASTRNLGVSSIESIEVITGVPSVEYGDLSNGIIKVNTRQGKSPFQLEVQLNQHTRQIALNKGFDLGHGLGILNTSLEHARSFSDATSPYTAYQRNILSLSYMNVWNKSTTPLTLHIGLSGNVGGYNSKADPDRVLDDFSKSRDNSFRAKMEWNWLLNKSWITNLTLMGSVSYADRKSESYTSTSSSSTQPYIHTTTQGYYLSEDSPTANVVLGPTGYWYVDAFTDSKPLDYALKLKGEWTRRFWGMLNKLMIGADYSRSENKGEGLYYTDLQYAPTWRAYRYADQPAINNIALYAEEKVVIPVSKKSTAELTAGLRDDLTSIDASAYGTVSSVSPRVNGKYIFWRHQPHRWVSALSLHAGWGKSVKLPSMQVLYPQPVYSDKLAFSSTSNAYNQAYYAYYTQPTPALYNSDLKWQYTNQTDVGVDFTLWGAKVTLSGFYHKTYHPYLATTVYTPMTYYYTSPSEVQNCGIPVANRTFAIDEQTGVVTVSDITGQQESVTLANYARNTYYAQTKYANGSPIERYGLEWVIDFPKIKVLSTGIRLDGSYYHYRGVDDNLIADIPTGISTTMSNGSLYQYVGYYRGSNVTSTGYSAQASVTNGSLSRKLNLNATFTTHIPKVRLIMTLRLESSLYTYSRSLCEYVDGSSRGYQVDESNAYFGTPYQGETNKYVIVYPEYYSTWDDPNTLIPFAEKFAWARENDQELYNDLSKLVVRSNYQYILNPNRLSAYYSANFSITKEIGNHVSLSFYANNFFNNMQTVHSTQTNVDTSLFASSYIPSFYYGLSLRLKL